MDPASLDDLAALFSQARFATYLTAYQNRQDLALGQKVRGVLRRLFCVVAGLWAYWYLYSHTYSGLLTGSY